MSTRKEAELLKFLRYTAHRGTLTESLASMFERKGLPDDFEGCEGLIEEILLNDGCGAYIKDKDGDGRWVFGSCRLGGMPDAYGFGRLAIITLKNGHVYQREEWRQDKDIVVVFNTPLRQPDLNIPRYSNLFAESETSLVSQLCNSRLHPIPFAKDEKQRVAMEEAAKDMDAGKLRTIISANVAQELIELGIDPNVAQTLQLSDPNASSHIQYISKLLDDLRRWFWQLYGHNPETNGKLAQQSVEEVSSGQSISEILPFAMYNARQREAKLLKEHFDWDVTIDFSEAWKRQIEEEGETNDDSNKLSVSDSDDMENAAGDSDADGSEPDNL